MEVLNIDAIGPLPADKEGNCQVHKRNSVSWMIVIWQKRTETEHG